MNPRSFVALALLVAWSSIAYGGGDPVRGNTLYHTTYGCSDCHGSSLNANSAIVVGGGGAADEIASDITRVTEMRQRYAATLATNATDLADLAAYLAQFAAGTVATPPVANYEGLWWNSPAGSESGWGINLAHQGDVIFATWFTYDMTGKAWWLSMTANKTADGSYTGVLQQTSGPSFAAVPWLTAQVTATAVGTGTLTFADLNNGTFAYTVNGITQSKSITRQVFGVLPTCTFGAQANLAAATNYQDLWWASPPGAESGWGINFTHQSDTIFATWFTYDTDRTPLWLSVTAPKTGTGTYTGTLYRTNGPAFNAVPFDPRMVTLTPVGTATFTFADGNTASFTYAVNGTSQTKPLTRQVFRTPGTVCQ